MAKKKANPFAKVQAQGNPVVSPIKTEERPVQVKTIVPKKQGRPSSFSEDTGRLTADIPKSTLLAMRRFLPDSEFISQAQLVNAAILTLLSQGNK